MRRAGLVVLALLLVPACKKKASAPPTDEAPAAPAEVGQPPDLSFIKGDVIVAETRDGLTRPVRLDPATGAWTSLGTAESSLYPTGLRVRGGILCIATWGTDEATHLEQLALVRGAAVERFGPRVQMVRNPTASRDGTTVIVETSELSFRDLYAVGADGKPGRLTTDEQGNFEPALSPDGSKLAFASSRDGNAELYEMPATGGAARRLTESPRDDWSPTWSPSGDTLAFLSDRDGAPRVYLMASGGSIRLTAEAAPEAVEDQPRWSPDGKTLAYLRGEGTALSVVLVEVGTGTARTVTPAAGADLDFAWSPDGQHLAVIRHGDRNPRSPATIAFVRVSDGVAVATDDTDGSAVRWIAP